MKLRTDEFHARLADARAQWSNEQPPRVLRYIDPMQEYWAVRDGGGSLGLIDRSDREVLVIHGKDTIPWLQGLVTADLMTLEQEGSGLRSSMVNQVGKAIADMRVLHLPDMLVIDLEPGNLARHDLLQHFNHHIIMEKVTLEDRTLHTSTLTLTGATAASTLDRAGFFDTPISRIDALYHGTWGKILGRPVVIQRVELTGEPTFDILCAREDAPIIWDRLLDMEPRIRPIGFEALEMLRLEAGVVRFDGEHEYHGKIIPIEANLNDTISYTKGCYLGQEVIHRLDTRGKPAKMLRALLPSSSPAPDDTLAPGMTLQNEAGKKVGELVRVSLAPTREDLPFAWAYIKRGAYEPGTLLNLARAKEDPTPLAMQVMLPEEILVQ